MIVKPSADGLAKAAAAAGSGAAKRGPPPVHLWNPPFCGDIDMEIRRNGTWFYLGTPIGRAPLVRLFSSVLWREGDAYFLVTPAEKVGIRVEDAPFVAVDVTAEGEGEAQRLSFTTNVDEVVEAGPDHPIWVVRDPATGEPAPYVLVRRNLEALIDRKTFYRMVDLGSVAPHEGADWFGVRSGGAFFPVIPAVELG
ncbi:MAG: DUF1285 domain-containing protein [Paracoccaceae bacterium]